VQALTHKACHDWAVWENSAATDSLSQDPMSGIIEQDAYGTTFGRDFLKWVNDVPGTQSDAQITADAGKANAGCKAVGINPLGTS
jgi:hypothetical protein